MKDKEKAKEDWTSLSLTIAVIVFVVIGYFTLMAFLSTKPESGYIVLWFLKFAETYGTFLAAIPVIIGVAVAKQQLDANRRQHKLTTQLTLTPQKSALDEMQAYFSIVIVYASSRRDNDPKSPFVFGLSSVLPSQAIFEKWSVHISPMTLDIAQSVKEQLEAADMAFHLYGHSPATMKQYELIIQGAQIVLNQVNVKIKEITILWS